MSFSDVLERVSEIRSAPSPDVYIKRRVAKSAQELSKAGELAARVEVITEALTKFTALLYQADTDGQLCNVDYANYRLLVPAPWGASGWRVHGLRHWEATALRGHLMERSMQVGKRPALFEYNTECRTWHMNALDYSSFEMAQRYLQKEALSVSKLRELSSKYKDSRVKVVSSHRHDRIKLESS